MPSVLPVALRERLRAWRYEASTDGPNKRDLRIDLLRGFCVFVMIVDHVGGETSWLYALTGGNRFFVSAAEGFVLLSGVSMGMVHRGVIQKTGVRGMIEKVFGRAWFLYALTVILTITFAAASAALGTPWAAAATPAKSGGDFALSVLTFRRSYSLTDVLVLYTLLVLAAGPALWLVARGHTALVLVSSWLLWALAQVWRGGPPQPWTILDGGFPFAAWQVLFFSGLVLGYHRQRIARWLAPSRTIAAGVAGVVALTAVELIARHLLGATNTVDVQTLLFDKNDARIGRVLALLAAASFGWALVTLAWAPLRRWTGWLLLRFGQQALFAYGVQLFVVAFWSSELMAPVRLDRENALFQSAAVLMVWAACVIWPVVQRRMGPLSLRRVVALPASFAAGATAVLPLVAVVWVASGTAIGAEYLPTTLARASTTASAAPIVATTAGTRVPSAGRIETSTFYSQQLRRQMPIAVYLPPGYDDTATRYPTVYMLHGGSGSNNEWIDYGLLDAAERLMSSGQIAPAIVVLPQGDQEYWVDHVVDASTGANGEKWGSYVALDVVPQVDRTYRTIAKASARGIGGLSMGGHAAIQLPLSFPGVWSAIDAISPALRPSGDAPTYLGSGAAFAARDPLSLIEAKPALAAGYTWRIDDGDTDPWVAQARDIASELTRLGIPNDLEVVTGDHSAAYWSAHVEDFLRYFSSTLATR
ncbi:MAG: OpgC domain-containing protein [Chloroflexota bacterium]|nr:OpgC domain-containing protein [Chloroflexota bacterium]MDE3192440.1 OpgC domain-containing protein [Chloroflexota bacterium]